ncbi:MAG TPA: tetratricopeptide repeat protein [Candidatus Polarisedimenticolaceae bacterium]|nr:tetratricopeptide repeat protein [Candidatus Polarisedimenticolaceae bacterium]
MPRRPAGPPSAARGRWMAAAAIALVTAFVFSPLLSARFVNYDDPVYVYENAEVRSGLHAATLRWAWTTGAAANWHPLTWMSHLLDVSLFGLSPAGHHASSVLLHVLNAVLLFTVLDRATRRRGRAAVVALLFALHPLHVQSVAWIAERKDVLSTLLWFAATLAYLGYARAPSAARWAAVTLLFALGLTAKPMLVTFPFALLLLDFWPLQRRGWKGLLLEKVPWVLLALASSVVTYLVQRAGRAVGGFEQYPWPVRLGNAVLACGTYLRKTLWPTDLAVFYPHPGVHLSWGAVALWGLLLAGISVAALRERHRLPWFFVGWFWFVGTLVPTLGLIQVGEQAMADRYTYVPLVGIFLAGVWAVAEWVPGRSAQAGLAAAAVLACAGATRIRELPAWRDSATLWTRALEATADNYTAMLNLSALRIEQGRLPDAAALLRRAVVLRPDNPMIRSNLGLVLTHLGQSEEAAVQYRRALELEPNYPEAHSNLGYWLVTKGRRDEAIAHWREAIRLAGDYAAPWYNWGSLLAREGQWAEAETKLRRALQLRPDYGEAHANLAVVLWNTGRQEEARRELHLARESGYRPPPGLVRMVEGSAP